MRSYYISNGSVQEGPYAIYELKEKKISSTTYVWFEGMESWETASQVPEIAELLVTVQTPPPLPFTTARQAVGPPPVAGNRERRVYKEEQDLQSQKLPGLSGNGKSSTKKVILSTVAGVALLVIGYIWYMNNVYYPETLARSVAWEQNRKRMEQEELERKAEERRKHIRNNFHDFIVPQHSSYTYYEIGGIENLSVTLHNFAEYRLDKVVVTVEYIKTNGGIFKTEDLVFTGIKAKSENTLKAPNSSRGTKVNCYVSYIYADRLNMEYNAYTGSAKRQSVDDPFKI